MLVAKLGGDVLPAFSSQSAGMKVMGRHLQPSLINGRLNVHVTSPWSWTCLLGKVETQQPMRGDPPQETGAVATAAKAVDDNADATDEDASTAAAVPRVTAVDLWEGPLQF